MKTTVTCFVLARLVVSLRQSPWIWIHTFPTGRSVLLGRRSFCVWLNAYRVLHCLLFIHTQSYLKDQWEARRNIPWNNIWRTDAQRCHTGSRTASACSSCRCDAGLGPTEEVQVKEQLHAAHITWEVRVLLQQCCWTSNCSISCVHSGTGLLPYRNQQHLMTVGVSPGRTTGTWGFSGATCFVLQSRNPSFNLLALLDRAPNLTLTHYSIWRHSIHIYFTWSQFHGHITISQTEKHEKLTQPILRNWPENKRMYVQYCTVWYPQLCKYICSYAVLM
jgi:hypothetical protein